MGGAECREPFSLEKLPESGMTPAPAPLRASEAKALNRAHARSVTPLQVLAVQARQLE